MKSIEWAAGFYEGEGCISLKKREAGRLVYPRLSISQRVREPLDWFLEAVGGLGRIYYRPAGIWVYDAGKTIQVLTVIDLMYIHLSARRQAQARRVICSYLDCHPSVVVAFDWHLVGPEVEETSGLKERS